MKLALPRLLPARSDPLQRTLRREAGGYARILVRKLDQLGVCYRYPRSQKDFAQRGVQSVRFTRCVATPDGLYYEIDTVRLPRGISLANINDTTILTDLSVACRRQVVFRSGVESGSWLVVGRDAGVWGIQSKIDFSEMMEHWPASSRKLLLLPLGVGENRLMKFDSLDDWPHALIGGATKSGKTTLLHSWICSLILHNRPDALKLVLIDLKGGVEFTRYREIPHLFEGGFIKDKEEVTPMLKRIQAVMERRLEHFEEAGGIQNVAAWNYQHRPRMYRVVVIIDELASIMLEPELKKPCEPVLADIGARGRAPGIHLVIATQRPEGSVVSGRIKTNLDARLAFRVPDGQSSMVILDDWSASQFPADTPRGRFMFRFGNDRRELQAPLIKPAQIQAIVDSLGDQEPGAQEEAGRVNPDEIFAIALRDLGGDFAIGTLYKAMQGRVSKRFLTKLANSYEGKVFEIGTELYELQPAQPGAARKLVRAGESTGSCVEETPVATSEVEVAVQHPETPTELTTEDILRFLVENLGSKFSREAVAQALGGMVTYSQLREIGQMFDGREIELGGEVYVLQPGAGRRARQVVRKESDGSVVAGELALYR